MIAVTVLAIGVDAPGGSIGSTVRTPAGTDLEYSLCVRRSEECCSPEGFSSLIRDASGSDLVIVAAKDAPGAFPRFQRLVDEIGEGKLLIVHSPSRETVVEHRGLFRGDDGFFWELVKYLNFGVLLNIDNIALIVSNRLRGTSYEVPHPFREVYDGIHVPGSGPVTGLDADAPRIGLMFSSLVQSSGDTAHIDAIVEAFASHGMEVLPVFYSANAFRSEGTPTPDDVIRRYLTRDGHPAVDALLLSSPFSLVVSSGDTRKGTNLFRELLDVPVFNILHASRGHLSYSACLERNVRTDVRTQTCLPEMDGQIITFSVSERDGRTGSTSPVVGGIDRLASLVGGWTRLGRIPNREKRVAIVIYQSRPDPGRIGNAAGLDTPASLIALLRRMRSEGYEVGDFPETPEAMMALMVSNVNNDADERSESEVRASDAPRMDGEAYREELDSVPAFDRGLMERAWGEPPGRMLVSDGDLIVPGLMFGNVFLGYQPMRGTPDIDIHDPRAPITHQYLAFYRWIRDVFRADAVIHFGTHGSLEWLPGKSIGMSEECFPDVALGGLPNICPYIVNDPGEGIQARRRSCAVLVSHLPPVMVRSGTYGPTGPLADAVERLVAGSVPDAAEIECIREGLRTSGIGETLGLGPDPSDTDIVDAAPRIHGYLEDIETALIKKGLHILGRAPEGEDLQDFIIACLPAGVKEDPGLRSAVEGRIADMAMADFDPEACRTILGEAVGRDLDGDPAVSELLEELVPGIRSAGRELDSVIEALDGRYVLPSRSGSVTKGDTGIFPTGRNMYGLDPRSVPSRAACIRGRRLAEDTVRRFVEDEGRVPRSTAVVLWATDVIKNGGDDVAMVFGLLGTEPEWDGEGTVTGIRIIPLEDLGRPRIDVTVRITGLFRDMFDDLIGLINRAVEAVSLLDEDDGSNAIRESIREDVAASMEAGIPEDEARMNAGLRVFGPCDGSYGFGMDIDSWDDVGDLAADYVRHGGYGFSGDGRCTSGGEAFVRRIMRSDLLLKGMTDREIDAVDTDDVFGFLGGLMAVQRAGGREPVAYICDNSRDDGPRVRTVSEELRFIFHSKLNNPRYADGLKEHGYRGAMEVSKAMDNLFGWSATGGVVDGWMYESFIADFLDREDVREWMTSVNPYAVLSIIRRLFEAEGRGLWTPSGKDVLDRLRSYYLDAESAAESMGDPGSPRSRTSFSEQYQQEYRASDH